MFGISKSDLEVTPIVAYGAIFMALVFGVMGLEAFWRHENTLAEKVVAVQNDLATQETLSGSDEWAARFEQSRDLRQQTLAALWSGNTAGVIGAELQQALRKDAQALGYEQIQVRVDPTPVDVDGLMVMSFEFNGIAPDGKSIVSLTEAVAVHPKRIILRDMDFSQDIRDRRRPRLAMGGIIPVQINTGAQAGGTAPSANGGGQ